MKTKNNIKEIENDLKNKKSIALIAPSFIVNFSYPSLIYQLKKLGFNKVVEITFGAKMVNREYQKKLKDSKKLIISSTCPGIINTIRNKFPNLEENLAKIDTPMEAMGKICKKHYPTYKTIFISPCDFKKVEAISSKYIDEVIDFEQLEELFKKNKIKKPLLKRKCQFDKFYNDYTKIYPLSGGLAKTANLKKTIKKEEIKIMDGINEVTKFLERPDKKIKFLDCLFCEGGCIGGPHTNKKISLKKKHKRIMRYLKKSKKECIPENRKGLIKKASGIKFSH